MNVGTQLFFNHRCMGRIAKTTIPFCMRCRLNTTGNSCWGNSTCVPASTSRALTLSHQHSASGLTTEQLIINETVLKRKLNQPCPHLRGLSDSMNLASFLGSSKASGWNKAVTEAEKIVGYPTSFMSLRCLLSDEFSNVAMHMRKLVGTKHPLLKTARRFVFDGTESLQMRGLLVLLVAKAAGPNPQATSGAGSEVFEPMVSGIYPNQRNLAEITEMIHTAHLVHTGVVNMASLLPADGSRQDIHFGNKLAVLCGDFLLANASVALAHLYNTEVVELISSAIRDMMIAEFTHPDPQTSDSQALTPEDSTITAWEKQTFLATGSLLAKSCKGALMLARHGTEQQDAAFRLGTSMGCAYQLNEDLRAVLKPDSSTCVPQLTSLPVALHLEKHPGDADLINGFIDTPSVKKLAALLASSGTIQRVRNLVRTYQQEALQAVGVLGENEARTAITNMVLAVTEE